MCFRMIQLASPRYVLWLFCQLKKVYELTIVVVQAITEESVAAAEAKELLKKEKASKQRAAQRARKKLKEKQKKEAEEAREQEKIEQGKQSGRMCDRCQGPLPDAAFSKWNFLYCSLDCLRMHRPGADAAERRLQALQRQR